MYAVVGNKQQTTYNIVLNYLCSSKQKKTLKVC